MWIVVALMMFLRHTEVAVVCFGSMTTDVPTVHVGSVACIPFAETWTKSKPTCLTQHQQQDQYYEQEQLIP